MAEGKRYVPNQQSDIKQILQEAQHRWLRPAEICQILHNYKQFELKPSPPDRPAAGSLFLFDRKALRYFRKDSHRWRKKKDGKTVKEAHEKLKAGSVDVLHCYYAHGEDNENFQRRSYWLLDEQLQHIVLVHYREVKEVHKSGVPHFPVGPSPQAESLQTCSPCTFTPVNGPASAVQISYIPNSDTSNWNGNSHGSLTHNSSLLAPNVTGFTEVSGTLPGSLFAGDKVNWPEFSPMTNDFIVPGQTTYNEQLNGAHSPTDAISSAECGVVETANSGSTVDLQQLTTDSGRVYKFPEDYVIENASSKQMVTLPADHIDNKPIDGGSNRYESGNLKKLDSFGRWMDKELGRDCEDSLMASDSGNYWKSLDTENDDKEVSSLSRHMQLDIDSLGPSLSQEQLFSIRDFSPDWAYSGSETKVLIVGTFLRTKKLSDDIKWGCMFGEIEVSAEVLTDSVIRCQAPSHSPGRVPFYVTCSNRLSCSEVREFEYQPNPLQVPWSRAVKCAPEEEVRWQLRFAKLVYLSPGREQVDCSPELCDACKLKSTICSMRRIGAIENTLSVSEDNYMSPWDKLVQNLLEERLHEWLVCKVHEGGKGPKVLDKEGLGVIHLAASLGYAWAVCPIIAAGVSPNFRDARGRTALHWASYFGREETVIALVRLGAAPGAVDDPTPSSPGGQTAADLASSRGHKGIAGYLAEADLISHLSSLNDKQNVMNSISATSAAEKAVQNIAQVVPFDGTVDELISLKGSLAAVRKSAHAAALIQSAFRARSFRQRQSTKSVDSVSEVSLDLVGLGSLKKVKNLSHFEDYLHCAAIKIQQKYRGWKGRREFLKIRKRIVQLQAHVRGHQARKQYQKVVWLVSIVEKVILRWRRKGTGLRGFLTKKEVEVEKSDEYEFLRISREQKAAGVEKALSRVKSMVHHREGRDQYMRLVSKFENFKIGEEGSSRQQEGENSENSRTGEGLDAFLAETANMFLN